LGPCVVIAGEDGRPLRPAILYGIDARAVDEIAELTARFGAAEILARGGSPLTTQSAGPKLLWLARHEPALWSQARRFFTAGSWLVHRLTGEYVLDHHSASQCGPLYDERENRWADDWAAVTAPGLPLPRRSFEAATWQTAKVAPDCHVSVGGALYSVPFRLIGARLDVRVTETMVFIYEDHEIVKSHARVAKGRRSTDWQDYPEAKAAFFMRTPSWCRRRATEIGPATTDLIAGLLGEQALHRLRSAQGVVHLADTYGTARLELACALAIEVGDPCYRTVKGILKAGREQLTPEPELATPLAPAHLHGPLALFADLEA
ncbi:MAG: FGGY family carbohydrate kinase, partial [Actinomycetes bacterium]